MVKSALIILLISIRDRMELGSIDWLRRRAFSEDRLARNILGELRCNLSQIGRTEQLIQPLDAVFFCMLLFPFRNLTGFPYVSMARGCIFGWLHGRLIEGYIYPRYKGMPVTWSINEYQTRFFWSGMKQTSCTMPSKIWTSKSDLLRVPCHPRICGNLYLFLFMVLYAISISICCLLECSHSRVFTSIDSGGAKSLRAVSEVSSCFAAAGVCGAMDVLGARQRCYHWPWGRPDTFDHCWFGLCQTFVGICSLDSHPDSVKWPCFATVLRASKKRNCPVGWSSKALAVLGFGSYLGTKFVFHGHGCSLSCQSEAPGSWS